MLLFKKEWSWTNRSLCTLLKSNVSDLLIFTSQSLSGSQKTSALLKQIFFSPYVFDSFSQLFSLALYKRVTVTLYKRAMWVICSFSWANAFSLFCSQKTSNLLKKPMSEFPTLVFEPKSKKFGISPIVPRANNMQMHKIFKKSEIDPLYSLHFT